MEGILVMKKWILLVVISFILVIGSTFSHTVNSGAKGIAPKNDDEFLKLILQIDGDKIQGEVKSLILNVGNNIFFFGDKGKCVKKIKMTESGPRFMISGNGAYCAIVNYNNDQINPKSTLSLFNANGLLIWEKEFNNFITPFKVANDGKRVLAGLVPYDEADYITLKYLNEKGGEIISVDALIEQYDLFEKCLPDNCRYWICKARDTEYWGFYDENGKRIRQQKTIDGYIKTIGDNGNYIAEVESSPYNKAILYAFNGDQIKNYNKDAIYLSRDGNSILNITKDSFVFENAQHKHQILDKKDVQSQTNNRARILSDMANNFSFDGSYFLIDLEPETEHWIGFIFKNGKIAMKKFDFNNSNEKYKLSHKILSSRNIIKIWSSKLSKGALYEVGVMQ